MTWKAIDGSVKQEVFVSSLAEKKVIFLFQNYTMVGIFTGRFKRIVLSLCIRVQNSEALEKKYFQVYTEHYELGCDLFLKLAKQKLIKGAYNIKIEEENRDK